MDNILITGGAGFVGSHLADRLSRNYNVVVIDNLLTGNRDNVGKKIVFIKGDVNIMEDVAPLFYRYNFRYVFHYAAVVGVKRTLQHPLMVLEDIQGFKNILHLSKSTRVERIFYSSSSEVYGEPVVSPQSEDSTPLNCKLPYAVTKNIGEAYLKSYKVEHGLDYTIFRFFNTFGPRQSKDFVMSKFIMNALQNKDITIYGDGLQTRSFNFVDNNIKACESAIKCKESINRIINVGDDYEITIKELAQTIKEYTNSKSNLVYLPPLEEGDMSRRKPDLTVMRELLMKNKTTSSLCYGIDKTTEYFRSLSHE